MSKVWSPYYWYLLHTLSYSYSEKNKDYYYKFLQLTEKVLPCPECRSHFHSYRKKNQLSYNSLNKESLIDWLIDYHNDVNQMTQKDKMSKTEVYNLYHHKGNLSINDKNIIELLKILDDYHREEKNGNFEAYQKFLKVLKEIYPCNDCYKGLSKVKIKNNKKCTKNFIHVLLKH